MTTPEPKKKFIIKKKTIVLKKPGAVSTETAAGEAGDAAPAPAHARHPAPAETPAASAPHSTTHAPRSEIKFYCIRCGQKLAVRGEMKGQQLKCPKCSRHITVPDPLDE